MNPPIFLNILKLFAYKIDDLDITIEQFPVMSKEYRLGFAEFFIPIFEYILFNGVKLNK